MIATRYRYIYKLYANNRMRILKKKNIHIPTQSLTPSPPTSNAIPIVFPIAYDNNAAQSVISFLSGKSHNSVPIHIDIITILNFNNKSNGHAHIKQTHSIRKANNQCTHNSNGKSDKNTFHSKGKYHFMLLLVQIKQLI